MVEMSDMNILIEGGFTSFFLDLLEQIRMAIKFIIKLT